MTRLLWIAAALAGGCGGGAAAPDALPRDGAAPDAPAPYDPLDGIGAVEPVAGGFEFVEGPQWLDDGTLLFSDIPAGRIYRMTPPSTVAVFRDPSGDSNGLALTADGALLAAEHGTRRVSITRAGEVTTLVDRFEGARLNSPNDVVARDDGTVFFTDPPYGLASDADRELDFMGVFRVAPGGAVTAEWRGPLAARPNGIALSPDQRTLYVADTTGALRAWDVGDDGALSGERTVSDDVPGADGLAVDVAGNLFVTTSAGVRVLAPDGQVWGTIAVPEQPANCAFGGDDARTLYVTARTGLYRVTLANPGLPRR